MPRVEDAALLTGRGRFLDDVQLAGALHVVFVRSQVAHGRLDSLDVSAARAADGVVAVFTADDLLGVPALITPLEAGTFSPPRPLLAHKVVRFVGEPIAAIVAESRYAGEDAAALVDVEVEPLPLVADAAGSLQSGAPVIHVQPDRAAANVMFDRCIESGDVESAFREAQIVVERTFSSSRCTASPMEGRGAAAKPEEDGVTIWCSTQGPHNLRRIVSELLGTQSVCVKCPDIGGGFGLKGVAYPEEILVAWLALALERPVKWVEDRVESLLASTHAREMRIDVKAAVSVDGKIGAVAIDVLCDTGAYGIYPQGHILEVLGVAVMTPGPYAIANYRGRVRALATNKCPSGPYRGVGLPVATFVHERLLDILAGELRIDRAELRRRNMVQPADMPYISATHQRYDSGDYPSALDAALKLIRYEDFPPERLQARARGELLGLGLSSYVEWTGVNSKMFKARGIDGIMGFDGAHIKLTDAGKALVWTTMPAIGQGTATTFAQTVADVTGIAFADVQVRQSDTSIGGLDGTGTFASRSAILGAGAIDAAGQTLRARLLGDAAARLEASPDDLEIADSRIWVRGSPQHAVTVSHLVAEADSERYAVSAQFDTEHVLYSYATHACRVRVDPETGALAILEYVVAEDAGRVVNPPIAEGQTRGGVAQGIGGAVYEALLYDPSGQPQVSSFMDYLIPTACEVPGVTVHHLELPVPDAMFGSKGLGEGGIIAPGGALANAVSDALGAECNELPLSPERLRQLALYAGATGS